MITWENTMRDFQSMVLGVKVKINFSNIRGGT